MINPNREWSVNLSKETLIKDIDDEIQKEYLEITKFSSEKFSLLLVIFGALTILIMVWPSSFSWSYGILFFLLASSILFSFWTYGETIKNWVKKILRISLNDPGSSVEIKQPNLLNIWNLNERAQLNVLLTADWQFAKKGEPHFRAFAIFLCLVVLICYANIQRWICIPHLSDPLLFGLTIEYLLLIYSFVIIITLFNPDIFTRFWEILFDFLRLLKEKELTLNWLFANGLVLIILGAFLILFWSLFFNILPLILLIWFVYPNFLLLIENFPNNLLILLLLTYAMNYLVEFMALIFGINLVENVKNEKIWWLEQLKIEVCSNNESIEREKIGSYYKKFDASDVYIPIPIQRFITFQKYVLYPRWLIRPSVDLESCEELCFISLRDRFKSHRDLLYYQRPLQKKF